MFDEDMHSGAAATPVYRESTTEVITGDDGVEHFAAVNAELIRTAAELSALATAADALGQADRAKTIRARLEHLASGAFVIAIVGEFKRGKSTLANALLGAEIMPSDVLPTTAAVNRIVFGRKPRVTLRLSDGNRFTISVEQLASHVTKLTADSTRRATALEEAIVAFPTHLCRHNVQVLDTPGLGDEAAMTERTARAIANVDAAVVVTSAISPFAQSEAELVQELIRHVSPSRLFFVVSQIDLVREKDVPRVVMAITRRIQAALPDGSPPPRVLPVSARKALDAKLARDAALLAESRFDALEHTLERFLVRDRGLAMVEAANEATASLGTPLTFAAHHQLAEIARQEEDAERRREERERALGLLMTEARDFQRRAGGRQEEFRAAARTQLGEIAASLWTSAKSAVNELNFTEAEVTDGTARHAMVERHTAPRLHAQLAASIQRMEGELVAWTTRELSELSALIARLDELLEADRVAADAAPITAKRAADDGSVFLGDVASTFRAAADEFKLSYVPATLLGTMRTLAGNVAGVDMVKRAWLSFQGNDGERLLRERTEMMAGHQRSDYVEHLGQAIQAELTRVDLVGLHDAVLRQALDKLDIKISGDVELVCKVCEIRPWELRIATQRERAERQRVIERISAASELARDAVDSASRRLTRLKDYLAEADAAPAGAVL